MADPFAYDPEKALWKPNRRGFLSLFGCAVASALLPSVPAPLAVDVYSHVGTPGWGSVGLVKGDVFTINGVYGVYPRLQDFIVTADVTDIGSALTIPVRPAIASDYKAGKIVFRGLNSKGEVNG